jgi:hypothetical protein
LILINHSQNQSKIRLNFLVLTTLILKLYRFEKSHFPILTRQMPKKNETKQLEATIIKKKTLIKGNFY